MQPEIEVFNFYNPLDKQQTIKSYQYFVIIIIVIVIL